MTNLLLAQVSCTPMGPLPWEVYVIMFAGPIVCAGMMIVGLTLVAADKVIDWWRKKK